MITKEDFIETFNRYMDKSYNLCDITFTVRDYFRNSPSFSFRSMEVSLWTKPLEDSPVFIRFLKFGNIPYIFFFELPETIGRYDLFRIIRQYFYNSGIPKIGKFDCENELIKDIMEFILRKTIKDYGFI